MKSHPGIIFLSLLPLLVVGCGGGGPDDYPDMGSVSGTVTMGGNPVSGAIVFFTPVDKANRPSFGTTDDDGYYELRYSSTVDGAKVGEHSISISTYIPPGPDEEGNIQPAQPETIPNKYNSKTELTKTVEAGSQTIDFELSADGEIDEHAGDAEISEADF